ncbi:MAG TPA: glycosyltransferase 87 family protein [Actinomycetota bacterium]
MRPGPKTATAATASLLVVLTATTLTLLFGWLVKAPCATNDWTDGRQYRRLCYSDIPPLFGTEHMDERRLPYLDPCPAQPSNCDEYPVLTMYFMRLAASLSRPTASAFFAANAALLAILAYLTAWMLFKLVGERALYFALAPTLLLYAFINWDLLAVGLAAAATLAFARRRDWAAGILIGLGAAAKLYPALLLIPFALQRLHERDRRRAAAIVGWAAAAWAVVNIPFALAAPHSWSTFFRLNADRPIDFTSVWYVACHRGQEGSTCTWSPHLVDAISLAGFVTFVTAAWWARRRRDPRFPRWSLAFPLIAAFLLTNKVYSAQYSLWLLPWFALALPNLLLFVLFEAADAAVFLTLFTWFGRLEAERGNISFAGFHGSPLVALKIAMVARGAILLASIVMWTRRRGDGPLIRVGSHSDTARAPWPEPDTPLPLLPSSDGDRSS